MEVWKCSVVECTLWTAGEMRVVGCFSGFFSLVCFFVYIYNIHVHKYNIHVYSPSDPLGYIDFFRKNYDIKSNTLSMVIFENKYFLIVFKACILRLDICCH